MNEFKPPALLIVERTPGGIHRVMFNVGSQYFNIAHVDPDPKPGEALEHCQFIAQMFAKAMAKIGVYVPVEERLAQPADDEDEIVLDGLAGPDDL